MNTYIISNSFTGYRAEIRTRNEVPAISTLKKHFRLSKASDCKSETLCRDAASGERVVIADTGHGLEVVRNF